MEISSEGTRHVLKKPKLNNNKNRHEIVPENKKLSFKKIDSQLHIEATIFAPNIYAHDYV